jgi:predicted alpha/beta-hydrolase family hydrolase
LERPEDARWILVLAHGAGAGMHSGFMEAISRELALVKIAVFRYQFPYSEQGRRSPDPQPVLKATVRSAIESALKLSGDLPLIAGGKSLGGRMTSMTLLPTEVKGLVFFGFPLHAPGKPSVQRADHLFGITIPMLFLQGTRDKLADLSLLQPVCERLGGKAALQVIDGADHSFHVLKSSGTSDEQVLQQLARATADWVMKL